MSKEETKIPEEMESFFDLRADTYDNHMKNVVESFDDYYDKISEPIIKTKNRISILDLGCGTGLEIKGIFSKAPNATITGIDMSEGMMKVLLDKYSNKKDQLHLIKGSYTEVDFKENKYDYIVSVMTMHHLEYAEKVELYKKIRRALRNGGKYIEGDYVVTVEEEKELFKEYKESQKMNNLSTNDLYHIDIPFSLKTQQQALEEAGFKEFKVIWQENAAAIYYGHR